MIEANGAGFKTYRKDVWGNGARRPDASLANQLERAEAGSPDLDSLSLLRRGHISVGAPSASRPPTARRGRQTTMHDRNDPTSTSQDSRRATAGCHGCHAPVTSRGVTPSAAFQTLYLPAGWGVTGVTARFQLIARTQAHTRSPALARITRNSAVTPVTPPETGGVSAATCRKGVTPPGVTPRDAPVTPRGWSA